MLSRSSFLALCLLVPLVACDFEVVRKTKPLSVLGIIDPVDRCGGVGTPLQLRISDCNGTCHMNPGKVYDCEQDFMPSGFAPSITLRVELCFDGGFCLQIINAELANSSVQPGFVYTAKFSLVPNDILSNQSVMFMASLLNTENLRLETCLSANIVILAMPSPGPLLIKH